MELTEEQQAERRKRILEKVKMLRLIDDNFMTKAFEDSPECVELVLRILMGKDDLKVLSSQVQYEVKNLQGQGVRFDVHALCDGKEVNIEIQRSDKGSGIKRARRNSSYMDANCEDAGEYGENLPETYVIFITENDKWKHGYPLYHIERCILETGEVVKDEAHIIYANGTYRGEDSVGKLMHDFFCTKADEMNYGVLAQRVRQLKETEKGETTMCRVFEEFGKQERAEGRAEGHAEGIEQGRMEGIIGMLRAGVDSKTVSVGFGLPVEEVTALGKQAGVL